MAFGDTVPFCRSKKIDKSLFLEIDVAECGFVACIMPVIIIIAYNSWFVGLYAKLAYLLQIFIYL